MKASLNWLSDFVDLSNIDINTLVDSVTTAGLEVENVVETKKIPGIVVAKITHTEKHPKADKLTVCTVYDGSKELQIICGAPNVKNNQNVILATMGTVMPNGLEIKEANIRGVNSFGMLCSEKELGIPSEENGIIVLEGDCRYGEDANDVLNLGDTILEFSITPNRGDCLSIYGLARDIAAILNLKLKNDHNTCGCKSKTEKHNDNIKIDIEDKDACLVYTAKSIKNIEIKPSPLWMQLRLKSVGIRPINNIVDITNYVMITYGQPLHAFDLDKLKGNINVRYAKNGEKLITLDGKERTLSDNILVISDDNSPLAVAGVMGGEPSSINDRTVNILLEAAFFSSSSVSRSSKSLNLSSDSSYRFIRGIDASSVNDYARIATNLILESCAEATIIGESECGVQTSKQKSFIINHSRINSLLGLNLSFNDIKEYLNRVNIEIKEIDNLKSEVRVPVYRNDISHYADIVEEVGRLYGLNNIPFTLPKFKTDSMLLPKKYTKRNEIRNKLAGLGFSEAINFSFISGKYLENFDESSKFVRLLNPISEELDTMKTLIYPGIIKNLESNRSQGEKCIKIFEIATAFTKTNENEAPNETTHLAIGIMGDFFPLSWKQTPLEVDNFYNIKGVIEDIATLLKVDFTYKADAPSELHPGKSASIYINNDKVGFIGALHPNLEEKLGLKIPVYIAELYFDKLIDLTDNIKYYTPFTRYPYIDKDISIIISKDVKASDIIDCAKSVTSLIKKVVIFDRYEGKGIEEGCISIAFRMWFYSDKGTLTDDEVMPLFENVIKVLEDKHEAKLR